MIRVSNGNQEKMLNIVEWPHGVIWNFFVQLMVVY